MRLKRVKIFGFKTFADKTEFEVDADLIAVIGPNGCGKSNLVDAILWGLGEGNARQLRAQKGTDVVFNGSSKRKPVGYAEVSLLFDNEDGMLPVSTAEVTITRRLTRSGESEYSINRQPCRLRDIFELLADSGLGRAGYAIVGQKEIDQALAASAEDRRAWVDEAAGVQRYRARKQEAISKLNGARQHLSRVHDILHEIEEQREPLREEAEVAKRFKAALGALREVESGLLVLEVAQAIRELEEIGAQLESAASRMDAEAVRADELENQASERARRLSEVESEMDALRALQQGALTSLERADAALQLGQQRLESFDELERSLSEEADRTQDRLKEYRDEVEHLRVEEAKEVQAFDSISATVSGLGASAQALTKALAEIESELTAARNLQAEALRREAEAEHRAARLKEIARERKGIAASLKDLQTADDEAAQGLREATGALEAAREASRAIAERLKAMREEDHAAQQRHRHVLAERAALEGRKRGIEATIESHEGVAQGARAVLEAVEKGALADRYTLVGDVIGVEKRFSVAIETALGAAANDLIVADEADAKEAIGYLKANRLGRATFQPIALMRPVHRNPDLEAALRRPGLLGLATEFVKCDAAYRPVIESLLGRVVIAEHLDAAVAAAKSGGWNRIVTLDGEIVHHSGAVTGGVQSRHGYGLVQRKADLAEIERELAELSAFEAEFDAAHEARLEAMQAFEVQVAEAERIVADRQTEAQDAQRWYASVHDELVATQRADARLAHEAERLEGSEAPAIETIDIAALEARRDAALKEAAAHAADANQAESRLREAELRRRQASERLQAAIRRLEAASENEAGRARKLAQLGPERDRIGKEIESARQQRAAAEAAKHDADRRLQAATEVKRQLLEESFTLSEAAKEARANARLAGDLAHQGELRRARAEAKRANAQQRLLEEYGLSEDEALELAPSTEVPDDAAQVTARLRREIKAMGDVNVGAIEAFERLTQRSDELEAQRADVEEGIREVESSIRELDKLTRDRFTATFESVEQSFSGMFQRVFPGGEGRLVLTMPDNLLESGIEIDVVLPGKKAQRLELLSGGERSLCAAAFLFSLLKVKPSPLVVLDEVDAPLDGRNVERFIDLLRDFSTGAIWDDGPAAPGATRKTQFIVITHNPTTIAAAPAWLGVTMQEPGVSTLVPARVDSLPEAPPATAAVLA